MRVGIQYIALKDLWDRIMIAIAFFCVLGSRVLSVKAASAVAVLRYRVFAFFSPDKARRRGVGLTARAGLEMGVNRRQ